MNPEVGERQCSLDGGEILTKVRFYERFLQRGLKPSNMVDLTCCVPAMSKHWEKLIEYCWWGSREKNKGGQVTIHWINFPLAGIAKNILIETTLRQKRAHASIFNTAKIRPMASFIRPEWRNMFLWLLIPFAWQQRGDAVLESIYFVLYCWYSCWSIWGWVVAELMSWTSECD